MGALLKIAGEPSELRTACAAAREKGLRVGLVPTMGALHEGHLALVDEARRRCDFAVVTIFVNPAQFGPNEDLARYPRDLEGDLAKLEPRGANLVFAPQVPSMYPQGHVTSVAVRGLTDGLCGASRPGHFAGVATIVCKLFNIVGPCVAVFGRKDYQQLRVVRQMVRDLDMPIEVVGLETVREPDGLAMSSRNAYLSSRDRGRGLSLARGLSKAHERFAAGERNPAALREVVLEEVRAAADDVDYVAAVDPETLAELLGNAPNDARLLIAVAARFGQTRLIDNTVLGEDRPPLSEDLPR